MGKFLEQLNTGLESHQKFFRGELPPEDSPSFSVSPAQPSPAQPSPAQPSPAQTPFTQLPPSQLQDNIKLFDSIKNSIGEFVNKVNNAYIKPLNKLGLGGIIEAEKDIFRSRFPREIPLEAIQETAQGAVRGVALNVVQGLSLGYSETEPKDVPTIFKPISYVGRKAEQGLERFFNYAFGKREDSDYADLATQAEKFNGHAAEFISWIIPFERAEKLLIAPFSKFAPKFVLAHPKLVKNFVDYAALTGIMDISAPTLSLTEEEKQAGVTRTQKLGLMTAGSVAFMSALKLFGLSLSKLGSKIFPKEIEKKVVDDFNKSISDTFPSPDAELTPKDAAKLARKVEVVRRTITPSIEIDSTEPFINKVIKNSEVTSSKIFGGRLNVSRESLSDEVVNLFKEAQAGAETDPILYSWDAGFRHFEIKTLPKQTKEEGTSFFDGLINFKIQGSKREILDKVRSRFAAIVPEIEQAIKRGEESFSIPIKLSDTDRRFLEDTVLKFVSGKSYSLDDFVSALTNKDIKSLSGLNRANLYNEANDIAKSFNYPSAESMYKDLLSAYPQIRNFNRPLFEIAVAPYTNRNFESLNELENELNTEFFKGFKKDIDNFFVNSGIKDFTISDSVGAWYQDGKIVHEASVIISSSAKPKEEVINRIAATLGRLREEQNAVYRIIFDSAGPDIQYSFRVPPENIGKTLEILGGSPFKEGFTIEKETGIIKIGDQGRTKIIQFEELINNLKNEGIKISKEDIIYEPGRIRYIGKSEYDGILQGSSEETWLKRTAKRRLRDLAARQSEISFEQELSKKLIQSSEAINLAKNKDIFGFVKERVLTDPEYSYDSMIKDIASRVLGKSPEELSALEANNYPEYRKIISDIDNLFKVKYKKNSNEVFDSWIRKSEENLLKSSPEELESHLLPQVFGTGETPFADTVILKNSAEANMNVAKDLQAGFIKLGSEKLPVAEEQAIERLFAKPSLWNRIKKGLSENVKEAILWTRKIGGEFEVDPVLNKKFPEFINWKIKLKSRTSASEQWASTAVGSVIKDLDEESYEVFRRIVALQDFMVTRGRGLSVPGDLTIDQISGELVRLYKLAREKHPRVISAVRRHIEVLRAIRDDMKSIGWLDEDWRLIPAKEEGGASYELLETFMKDMSGFPDAVLEDFYFPHKVMDYLNFKIGNKTWIPTRMRKPFKGYLKERIGSIRDIETDYADVMSNYFANVKLDIALEKDFNFILQKYDLLKMLDDDAIKSLAVRGLKVGHFIPEDKIPEAIKERFPDTKWRLYQYEKGNYVFPATTLNEKILQEALEESATVGDWLAMTGPRGGRPTREMLVLGSKKPVYALPEPIYKQVQALRSQTTDEMRKLIKPVVVFTKWFKPLVTKWLGGIPFQVRNAFGDFFGLFLRHPQAYARLVEAARIAREIIFKNPDDMSEAARLWQKRLTEEAVLSSSFATAEAGIGKGLPSQNPFIWFDNLYDKAVVFRELVPKLASILDNLNRLEKGLPLKIKMADEFIKQMVHSGSAEEVVYAFGRGVTVDYAALPDGFRKVFSEFLAPFAFWFARTTQTVMRGVKEAPFLIGSLYLLPMIGAYMWNNSKSNRTIEEGLPEWMRGSFHLILGETDSGKKIVWVPPGVDILNVPAQIFGIDKFFIHLEDYQNKKITAEEAATRWAYDIVSGPPRFMVKIISPIAQAIIGVASNKDPFTDKEIVPENLKGTIKERELQAQYVIGKLAAPLLPFMNADSVIDIKENTSDWVWEVLKKPIDPTKAIGFYSYTDAQLLANIFNDRIDKLEAQKRQWLSEFDDLILNLDKNGLQKKLMELNSPDAPLGEEAVANHIVSPSFVKTVIRGLARKADTKEKREELRDVVRILQLTGRIKSLPNDLKEILLERSEK